MRNKYLLIILAAILVSCNKTSRNDAQGNDQIEVIDLMSSGKKKVSELFSSFEIIPLETHTSSLVGLYVVKMEFYRDKIYLLNRLSSRKNILCFDSNGKFSFVIDRIGEGPGEYAYLQDFIIDSNREELILFCGPNESVISLDLNGNFIKAKAKPDALSYLNQIVPLNDSAYMVYSDVNLQPVGFNLIQLDATSLEIKRKSDKMKEYTLDLGIFCLTYYNNNVFYYNNISDTIYNATDIDSITPLYYINSGKDTQDAKKQFKALASKSKDRDQFIEESLNILYDKGMKVFYSYYLNSSWVAINIFEPKERYKMEEGVSTSIIFYNKKDRKSYSSKNIVFDIFNLKDAIPEIKLIGSSDESFYLLIRDEFTEKQKAQIRQSKLTEDEKNILINRTEEDNPIVIKMTI